MSNTFLDETWKYRPTLILITAVKYICAQVFFIDLVDDERKQKFSVRRSMWVHAYLEEVWLHILKKYDCIPWRSMIAYLEEVWLHTLKDYDRVYIEVVWLRTLIPTSMLCFVVFGLSEVPDEEDAFLRKNLRVNFRPNLRLSPHPPHFQASLFACWWYERSSHVHRSSWPRLHALDTACTRPADEIA